MTNSYLIDIFVKDMTRQKEKPDFTDIGINPFEGNLVIRVNKKSNEVTNKFGNPDKIESLYESVKFTKVFDQAGVKELLTILSAKAKEMYLHIIYSLEPSCDIIWIHKDRYMKSYGIKSINTFKEAVKGLSENGFIYPHVSIKDSYWINPHYFFKGNRFNKYPTKLNK